MKKNKVQRMKKHPLQKGKDLLTANYKFFQKHPVYTAVSLIILYFLCDIYLLNLYDDSATNLAITSLLLVLLLFYFYYVHGYVVGCLPKQKQDIPTTWKYPKRMVLIGYGLIGILTLFLAIGYPIWIKAFSNVDGAYYQSQVILLICIAPVVEELCFRYFLYDRWARVRFGKWKGFFLTGFLFVLCHPVSDIQSMVLYWIPTICFYFVYDSFGLYGSIVVHMLFNFIAL